MKPHILYILPILFLGAGAHAATACSRANLTRCLDSACAINLSSNAAARCQYCGTATAGTPSNKNEMRSVSVGASAKYNIDEKELKKAPKDPGERYSWATKLCLKKVSGCSTDDVSEIYDPLIEQSCKAAGVSAQFTQTLEQVNKKKTKTACTSEIQSCLIDDNRCMADFRNCEADTDFDKFFSQCGVVASGCDEHISTIRDEMIADRDSAIKNADSILAQIVAAYTKARDTKLNKIKNGCRDNSARDNCIKTVCANNMPHKCTNDYEETEKVMATDMCKFYEIACETID